MYGLTKVGEISKNLNRCTSESRLGIGLEKLDRNLYDPADVYDPISKIGVKWVRIQSGWCRTEKEKGVYDFKWLDDIVDNLLKRNMTPWICLCYGNELYSKNANNKAGSVGVPPIFTEEERNAWCKYVCECVKHFENRVEYFEIWNEPDGKWCWRHGPNAIEYGNFALITAKAIRKTNSKCKIIAGAFCLELSFLYSMLTVGLAPYIDYITYHRYKCDMENYKNEFLSSAKAVIRMFSDKIKLIQGETGAQSRYSTNGALNRANWTELKQSKYLLRQMVSDLATDVFFTSYFSSVDIYENIMNDVGTKTEDYYGFFGILGENFDKNGHPLGTYREKLSYRSFQVLATIMNGEEKNVDLPIYFSSSYSSFIGHNDEDATRNEECIYMHGFELKDGVKTLSYWKATDIMTTDFDSTVSLSVMGLSENMHIIDLLDGTVYNIDAQMIEKVEGVVKLNHIPIKDYPLLLAFGNIDYLIK